MPTWLDNFNKKPKTEETTEGEIELKPADVKAKLDKIDTFDAKFTGIETKLSGLDNINAYITEQRNKEAEAIRVKAAEDAKKRNEAKNEEDETDWLTDPANAAKRLFQEQSAPLVANAVNMAAKSMARDLFDEHVEEYPYANDPVIKADIEKQLMSVPLAQRANVDTIANCYYVATGRRQKDITEGKIKSRIAAGSGSGSGTGTPGSKSEETVTLTAEQQKAAKLFGMSDKEYYTRAKEMNYV